MGRKALRSALLRDDWRLLQGLTVSPPPLAIFADSNVEGACVLGYCGWKGENCKTVAQVAEYQERLCLVADEVLDEPGASRYFLSWIDETPRSEMRRQLLAELNSLQPAGQRSAA